jgi:uncharacterized protein (DUF697 family)
MFESKTRSRSYADVRTSLAALAQALPALGSQYACVVHCMQPHRASFYLRLGQEFGVQVVATARQGVVKKLSQVAIGTSALIVIKDSETLQPIFLRISEQAMAALYVINSPDSIVKELACCSFAEATTKVRANPTHLCYQVDEDTAVGDDLVTEVISVGPDCPKALRDAVEFDLSDST